MWGRLKIAFGYLKGSCMWKTEEETVTVAQRIILMPCEAMAPFPRSSPAEVVWPSAKDMQMDQE